MKKGLKKVGIIAGAAAFGGVIGWMFNGAGITSAIAVAVVVPMILAAGNTCRKICDQEMQNINRENGNPFCR